MTDAADKICGPTLFPKLKSGITTCVLLDRMIFVIKYKKYL